MLLRAAIGASVLVSLAVGWLTFAAGNDWFVAFARGYAYLLLMALSLYVACRALLSAQPVEAGGNHQEESGGAKGGDGQDGREGPVVDVQVQ